MSEERLFPLPAEKRCSTCKAVKPLTEFNRRSASPDGRQWSCRECNKRYHYENLERHMGQIRRRKRERVDDNRRRLFELLVRSSCVDCGTTDPIVLDFDHLRDKAASVSRLVFSGAEWATVEAEIAKCDIVCSNCHRRRTARRAGSYRHRFLEDLAVRDARVPGGGGEGRTLASSD
jgi:5-methylcytosine-specific restriction endonuclease McrA